MLTFAKIALDGTVLQVAKGDFSWPSVAAKSGLGEWVPFPYSKARVDVQYNRVTQEFESVE